MKVLFKGNSMVSNEPKQLECDINHDRYSIKDYLSRITVTVNDGYIAIKKDSFIIEVLEGDMVADI